jgi:hypothetical protein
MSVFDRNAEAEHDFEQRLLETARMDVAPKNVEQAWAEFTSAIQTATAHVEPGSGLRQIEPAHRDADPSVAPGTVGMRASLGKAFTCVVLGALGGSAATASVMSHHQRPTAATQLSNAPSAAPSALASATPTLGPLTPPEPTIFTEPARVSTGTRQIARTHRDRSADSSRPSAEASSDSNAANAEVNAAASVPASDAQGPRSALAREVQQLDLIRRACRAGAYSDALHLVTVFHREFPNSVLAPDADVLQLEALAERHDYPTLATQAAAFLAKYPSDPHAAKARRWAEIANARNSLHSED